MTASQNTAAGIATVFSTASSWPPSLANSPLLAMIVTSAFWICLLLCFQWGYALIDSSHDRQTSWTHPLKLSQLVKFLMLTVVLFITAPRVALLTVWHSMSPFWREWCSAASWTVYVPAAGLFMAAWWIDRRSRQVEEFQMVRSKAPPIDMKVQPYEIKRTIGIMFLVLLISFATTFIRKAPHGDARVSTIAGHQG